MTLASPGLYNLPRALTRAMEKITGGRDGRGVAGITGSNSRQRRSCRAVIDRGASIGSPC